MDWGTLGEAGGSQKVAAGYVESSGGGTVTIDISGYGFSNAPFVVVTLTQQESGVPLLIVTERSNLSFSVYKSNAHNFCWIAVGT